MEPPAVKRSRLHTGGSVVHKKQEENEILSHSRCTRLDQTVFRDFAKSLYKDYAAHTA